MPKALWPDAPRARRSGRRRDGATFGKKLAAAAAVLAALALSGYLVYASVTSKPWRLGGYTVRGMSYLTAREVLAAAGFEAGDNLFWADLDAAERKLCRHPRIRRAKVARRLPAEVVIAVEERPAAAAFVLNGELYKVSSDGVVLGPMAAGYEDLPILVGVRYRAAQDVRGKKLSRGELGDALATLEALSRVDPAWAAAIEYVDVNDRVVALAAGRYVIKYSANFDERTARRLRRVYEATRANGHGGATYDVRFGTDVVVTYRDARAGGAGGGSADDGAV
jgi:cell division septal protein FtsQ